VAHRLNIGAHISIAGGVDRAPFRAQAVGCECMQIFTAGNRQWRARPIGEAEARRFRDACRETGIAPVYAHSGYLINLAAADGALRRRSERAFAGELDRAEQLGLPWVVVHPGSHGGAGEAEGLRRVARAVDGLLRATRGYTVGVLLETTSGGGSALGHRFEHLARILAEVSETHRVGVCFDTCHVFAAGYDLRTRAAFRRTFAEFDRVVGLGRLKALHLNDSRGDLGSRRDRHEHIGRGRLGREAFGLLVRARRFRAVPKFLETPKGRTGGREWDALNLSLLRRLARARVH